MSLYVPAMQNASYANLISQSGRDTARSFLDGVRMHNENKHKAKMMENEQQRIDIQRESLENTKSYQDKSLGLQKDSMVFNQGMQSKNYAMREKQFNQNQKRYQNEQDLIQGAVKYKLAKMAKDDAISKRANELHDGPAEEKESFWFKRDAHGKDGIEIYQYQTPTAMAEADLRHKGKIKDPKFDPNLTSKIQSRDDISLLDMYSDSPSGLFGSLFGE